MQQFSLPEFTPAQVTKINKRVEQHGDETVHAKDVFWKISVPNSQLDDWFGPDVRHSFYELPTSATIEGVPEKTTVLRTDRLEPPFKLVFEGLGYHFTVDRGRGDEKSCIDLWGVDVNKMRVTPLASGWCDITFRTQMSGLEGKLLGLIDELDGHAVKIMAEPSAMRDEADGDGDGDAAGDGDGDGDTDGDAQTETQPEAGDIFAAQHGEQAATHADQAGAPVAAKKAKGHSFKARAAAALKKAAASKPAAGQTARPH